MALLMQCVLKAEGCSLLLEVLACEHHFGRKYVLYVLSHLIFNHCKMGVLPDLKQL